MDPLRFDDPRTIDPVWPDHCDEPWLELACVEDDDRSQLEAILRQRDPQLNSERIARETARELFTGALEGFEEEPVEIWDVIDSDSYVRCTLWLYLASQGVLFEAGGVKIVGEVIHGSFHGNEESVDYTEERELIERLEEAQKIALVKYPRSVLADVTFKRKTRY